MSPIMLTADEVGGDLRPSPCCRAARWEGDEEPERRPAAHRVEIAVARCGQLELATQRA